MRLICRLTCSSLVLHLSKTYLSHVLSSCWRRVRLSRVVENEVLLLSHRRNVTNSRVRHAQSRPTSPIWAGVIIYPRAISGSFRDSIWVKNRMIRVLAYNSLLLTKLLSLDKLILDLLMQTTYCSGPIYGWGPQVSWFLILLVWHHIWASSGVRRAHEVSLSLIKWTVYHLSLLLIILMSLGNVKDVWIKFPLRVWTSC